MYSESTIIEAARNKNFISFSYDGHLIRKASSHAIYISTAGNRNLDAYQLEGYTESGGLPGWRQFLLEKISNVEILDERFQIAPGYNPNSPRYNNCVFKI